VVILLGAMVMLGACKSKKDAAATTVTPATPEKMLAVKDKVEHEDWNIRFGMRKGQVVGDSLMIRVKYGGGCNPHKFTLETEKGQEGTIKLMLLHHTNDDPCKAFVNEHLKFDISPLKKHFTAPVVFTINNQTEEYTYE